VRLHAVRRPRLALGDGAATRVGYFSLLNKEETQFEFKKGVFTLEEGVVALEKRVCVKCINT